ncbi:MAG: hypothetical protein ACKPA9_30830, partial [Microcystis sp.]
GYLLFVFVKGSAPLVVSIGSSIAAILTDDRRPTPYPTVNFTFVQLFRISWNYRNRRNNR